jgi:hypothetical protein
MDMKGHFHRIISRTLKTVLSSISQTFVALPPRITCALFQELNVKIWLLYLLRMSLASLFPLIVYYMMVAHMVLGLTPCHTSHVHKVSAMP